VNWEQIYREHVSAMMAVAERWTRLRPDLDPADVAHEAFAVAISDPPADEPNWLDFLTRLTAQVGAELAGPFPDEPLKPVEDTAIVAMRRVDADEARQRILRVMNYMTERQREVTRLRLFEGLSVGEIATIVHTSSSNISQIVIRCLTKLEPVLTHFDTFDHRDLEQVRPPRRVY
jgi:RNA polymerase sigma factor (sigma-70 family)